jgi:hypothetical protein
MQVQSAGELAVAARRQERVSVAAQGVAARVAGASQGVASRVSVASRFVKAKHDDLSPAVNKEFYQLHRTLWVYKISNNWEVLTQFYCTLICTQ